MNRIYRLIVVLVVVSFGDVYRIDPSRGSAFANFPLGRGFDSSIMKPKQEYLLIPELSTFDVTPLVTSRERCDYIQHSSDFHEKMHIFGELEIKYLMFEGKGSVTFDREEEEMRRTVHFFCQTDRTLFNVAVNSPHLYNQNSLNPRVSDVHDSSEALNEFGSHYVNAVTYGRRYSFLVSISFSHGSEFDNVEASLMAKGVIGVLQFAAKIAFEKSKSSTETTLEISINSDAIGFIPTKPLHFAADEDSIAEATSALVDAFTDNINDMNSMDGSVSDLIALSECGREDVLPSLKGAFPVEFSIAENKPYIPILQFDMKDFALFRRHIDEGWRLYTVFSELIMDVKTRAKELYAAYGLDSVDTLIARIFQTSKRELMDDLQSLVQLVRDYTNLAPDEILDRSVYAYSDNIGAGLTHFTESRMVLERNLLLGLSDVESDNDDETLGDKCVFHGISAQNKTTGEYVRFAGSFLFPDVVVHHVVFNEFGETTSLSYIRDQSGEIHIVYVKNDCSLFRVGDHIRFSGARYKITEIGGTGLMKNGRLDKSRLRNVRVVVQYEDINTEAEVILTMNEFQHVEHLGEQQFSFDDSSLLLYRDGYVCDTAFGMNEAKTICSVMGYTRVESLVTGSLLPPSDAFNTPHVTMDRVRCDYNAQWGATSGPNCTYDAPPLPLNDCAINSGVKLVCGKDEPSAPPQCQIGLWAESSEDPEHECMSDGFGEFSVEENCNGGADHERISSVTVSGSCCSVFKDENSTELCILGAGSFSSDEVTEYCGSGHISRYETVEATIPYIVGGEITGLDASNVTLINVETQEVLEAENVFEFKHGIFCGSPYDIQVLVHPEGMACQVNQSAGIIAMSSVYDVNVACKEGDPADLGVEVVVTMIPSIAPTVPAFDADFFLSSSEKSLMRQWSGDSTFQFKRCYSMSQQGGSASFFHAMCDLLGPTFTVAQLDNGKRIGGFGSKSWTGPTTPTYIPYQGSDSSCLFSLTNQERYYSISSSFHQKDGIDIGPTFGASPFDFHIAEDMQSGVCNLGTSYSCLNYVGGSDACQENFCGSRQEWTIAEVQVFYSVGYSAVERQALTSWGVPSDFGWRRCDHKAARGWTMGWDPSCFGHDHVILVTRGNGAYRFGAYSQAALQINDYLALSSFLFSLTHMHKYVRKQHDAYDIYHTNVGGTYEFQRILSVNFYARMNRIYSDHISYFNYPRISGQSEAAMRQDFYGDNSNNFYDLEDLEIFV